MTIFEWWVQMTQQPGFWELALAIVGILTILAKVYSNRVNRKLEDIKTEADIRVRDVEARARQNEATLDILRQTIAQNFETTKQHAATTEAVHKLTTAVSAEMETDREERESARKERQQYAHLLEAMTEMQRDSLKVLTEFREGSITRHQETRSEIEKVGADVAEKLKGVTTQLENMQREVKAVKNALQSPRPLDKQHLDDFMEVLKGRLEVVLRDLRIGTGELKHATSEVKKAEGEDK